MCEFVSPKHAKNFKSLSYTNPNAPKKGVIKLPAKRSTFSSFNPFILNGVQASGLDYLHASLMKVPLDDQMVAYPYIAQDIEITKNGLSVIFTLRKEAQFSDRTPITAEDVVFSYTKLKTEGSPAYAMAYENVASAKALNSYKVQFDLKTVDRNTPFSLAKMPVISKNFYTNTPFNKASMISPIGSGPYKLKDFKNGKYVIYERIKSWWGEDIPVVKGLYNFDKIKFVHYYNYDAIVDGLKRGEIDHNIEMKVSRWQNQYETEECKKGSILKKEFKKPVPHGLNAFFFNTRRPQFSDQRVRKALNLLFNFEWINKTLFNNHYKRNEGIFNSKDYNAQGKLSALERKLLKELGIKNIQLYEEFDSVKPNTPQGLERENIDHAIRLLIEAGWVLKEGVLTHPQYGEFTLEILLPAASMTRMLENYRKTLRKMGVHASIKTVDPAQFESRLHNFDYDLILFFMPLTYIPGKSLKNMWASESAHIPGSLNLSGIKNKYVDHLIKKINQATQMKDIKLYASVLDRILRSEYLYIPAWYRDEIYVAYWNKFGYINKNENGYSINAWWSKE